MSDRLSTPKNARFLGQQGTLRPFVAYDRLYRQVTIGLDADGYRSAYANIDMLCIPKLIDALVGVEVEHALAEVAVRCAEIENALRAFVDDEPCEYDHHGGCQMHDPNEGEGMCRVAVARRLLGGDDA